MPEVDINSEKYIKDFLPRLEFLLGSGRLCTMQTDDNRWILCEMWHFPERRETDPDHEYEIFPIAKFLTDEETAELKMEEQTPERKDWCYIHNEEKDCYNEDGDHDDYHCRKCENKIFNST